MTEIVNRLETLLNSGKQYFEEASASEIAFRPQPNKWSKKEILGHLIDSAVNNLQRFTEIPLENQPYKIRTYKQDGLVKTNDYQNSETHEIVNLWLALNTRISKVITSQTGTTLKYEIIVPNGDISDLEFLIKDYVDHLEHHLNQIIKK